LGFQEKIEFLPRHHNHFSLVRICIQNLLKRFLGLLEFILAQLLIAEADSQLRSRCQRPVSRLARNPLKERDGCLEVSFNLLEVHRLLEKISNALLQGGAAGDDKHRHQTQRKNQIPFHNSSFSYRNGSLSDHQCRNAHIKSRKAGAKVCEIAVKFCASC